MAKDRFKSRSGFILASVGAAVGLGDSLRFPGLCAKYGGGTFMFIYVVALLVIGIPLLNAEIALGRKFRAGAPKCMRSLDRRAEPLGWASCFNSLFVAALYAGMLGWIIAMLIKIAPLCKQSTAMPREQISAFFFDGVLKNSFSPFVFVCVLAAWLLMYLCLKNGADSLSKTAKFTVLVPVFLLVLFAARGLTYSNSGKALYALFVPDFSKLGDAELWLNAVGQVFFSLSVLVGIMPAYGAYLPAGENILCDGLIIALSDFLVSVLSSVVLFTTLYGCGLENSISASGIATAFMLYPVAITVVCGAGNTVLNSIVGILFYASLGMMALQSASSMVEAAANPLADKLNIEKGKISGAAAAAGALLCAVFATSVAPVILDVCDHFLNYFNILVLGVFECVILGANAKRIDLCGEINRHSKRLKMPAKPLILSLKYLSPAILCVLFAWGVYHLVAVEDGRYAGYPVWAQAVGWAVGAAALLSGFIVCGVARIKRKRA